MGCRGLHDAIRERTRRGHISSFAGKVCAIDGYSWLHRAAYSDIRTIANSQISSKVTNSVLRRVKNLASYGVRSVIVFDGWSLPMKSRTNLMRSQQRAEAKQKAEAYRKANDKVNERKCLAASLSISWQQVEDVMAQLEIAKIPFIVAPYEADAQLGYLSRQALVDFVVSEDSDLLLYGVQCMVSKYEPDGSCVILTAESLLTSPLLPPVINSLQSWIMVVCLSGCDYTDGVYGIGIVKASRLLQKVLGNTQLSLDTSEQQIKELFGQVLGELGPPVSDNADLLSELFNAFLTFRYHRVFDPRAAKLATVSCVQDPEGVDLDFLGNPQSSDLLLALCRGAVDPHTGFCATRSQTLADVLSFFDSVAARRMSTDAQTQQPTGETRDDSSEKTLPASAAIRGTASVSDENVFDSNVKMRKRALANLVPSAEELFPQLKLTRTVDNSRAPVINSDQASGNSNLH